MKERLSVYIHINRNNKHAAKLIDALGLTLRAAGMIPTALDTGKSGISIAYEPFYKKE